METSQMRTLHNNLWTSDPHSISQSQKDLIAAINLSLSICYFSHIAVVTCCFDHLLALVLPRLHVHGVCARPFCPPEVKNDQPLALTEWEMHNAASNDYQYVKT